MNNTINFGILGCGSIASTHVAVINSITGANLIGVADAIEENAKKFAEVHKIKAYQSYKEMLADPSINAICVCTPSYFHEENAIDALTSGKHVVLEKPMALTTAACDRIIKKCEESGKLLTVISQNRFSDDIDRIKGLIRDGALGKISLCSLYMNYYRNPSYYKNSNWRGTLKYDGGGALINQGIHGIDLVRYIMGNITQVQAMKKTAFHSIEAEDSLVAIVEFECGAMGTIEASTCAYPGFERRIKICGSCGYAVIVENKLEELMINGEKAETNSIVGQVSTSFTNAVSDITYHKAQFENFIDAINGNASVFIDGQEGKLAVDIIERIYNSANQNK